MGTFLVLVYLYVLGPNLTPGLRWDYLLGPSFYNSQLLFPILIPLTILGIHFTREKGLLTLSGTLKFSTIVAEILLLTFTFQFYADYFYALMDLIPQYRIFDEQLNVPIVSVGLCILTLPIFVFSGEKSFYNHYNSLIFWTCLTAIFAFVSGIQWQVYGKIPLHVSVAFTGAGILFNAKVFNLAWSKAYRDQLTQIYGRMALDELLKKLTGHYCIAMIDIDHFKKFNDKYGHDAGDKVLRMVANTINTYTSGETFRFGGEEFTVVYRRMSIENAEDELESLRKIIANNKVKVTRKSKRATKVLERKVTISIGLAEHNDDYTTPEDVLNAADNALFKAKDEGRNCLIVK